MEIMELPQTSTTEPMSTDLLFSLPPELLLVIISFVGAENFRQDVRRLAVCKKWYAYARPVLLGHLRLCATDLLPMLHAMNYNATLVAAQQMTKHIHLNVSHGFAVPSTYPQVAGLEQLASRLKVFAALRTLIIRSSGHLLVMNSQVFSSFATLHQLASLEMDLEMVRFRQSGPHLCKSISRLIPCLKSLRCRLPRICNNLLETPPGNLQELILVISRTKSLQFDTYECLTGFEVDDDRHRAALEAKLTQFAASMRNPKTVRLLHRFQNPRNTYAFDAIKERRFLLGQDPAWDAHGVLLPEDWEESEQSEESEDDDDNDEEVSTDENFLEYDGLDELTEDEWSEDE